MRNSRLIFLVLAFVMIGTLVMAQRSIQPATTPLSATELEKLADTPSVENAILRLAAEKLRVEKRAMDTVELPLTIKVSAATPGCHHMCVWQGTKCIACEILCKDINRPD